MQNVIHTVFEQKTREYAKSKFFLNYEIIKEKENYKKIDFR